MTQDDAVPTTLRRLHPTRSASADIPTDLRAAPLDATWQTAEAATSTLLGTPFGPQVSALPAEAQQQLRARFASKLGDSAAGVTARTVSNIARGTK